MSFNEICQRLEGQIRGPQGLSYWHQLSELRRLTLVRQGFDWYLWDSLCMNLRRLGLRPYSTLGPEDQEHPFVGPRLEWDWCVIQGCSHIPWAGLTDAQRYLAETDYGFNQNSWNTKIIQERYYTPWSDLTRPQRELAEELGFNQESWDLAVLDSSAMTPWHNLDLAQQLLATKYGYDKLSWDTNVIELLYATPWFVLTQPQRELAEELGFNQDAWDYAVIQGCYTHSWEELTWAQRNLAQVAYGYTIETWNAELAGEHAD